MYPRYSAAVLAAAGLLVIACGEHTAPTSTSTDALSDKRQGRVKIDGVIGSNEWRDAAVLPFMANAPEGLVSAELLAQRDDRDLYLAVRIQRPAAGLSGFAEFQFDSDNDGVPFELLDDVFSGGGVPPANDFGDNFVVSDGFSSDFEDGGTSDGVLAVGSTATSTTYELRRPLDSGDIHDVRLSKLFSQSDFELRIGMTIPGGTQAGASGETTMTQVPTYGGGCKLTAFPAVRITGCPTGDVAMVRVTPPSSTVMSLISMPTFSTFVEPLRLSTYDYLGNLVTATCTWQSTSPEIVQVDQQGHVSTGAATGSSFVGAVCLNRAGLPLLGSVRIDVS